MDVSFISECTLRTKNSVYSKQNYVYEPYMWGYGLQSKLRPNCCQMIIVVGR